MKSDVQILGFLAVMIKYNIYRVYERVSPMCFKFSDIQVKRLKSVHTNLQVLKDI